MISDLNLGGPYAQFMGDPKWDFHAPEETPIVKASAADKAMYKYQRDTVGLMVRKKRCILAFTMGLGKTLTSIATASVFHDEHSYTFVICPSYLVDNWSRELETWWGEIEPVVIKNTKEFDKLVGRTNDKKVVLGLTSVGKVVVVSYDLAAKFFGKNKLGFRLDNVIVDESHYLKSHKTKRFTSLSASLKHAKRLYLLTGTPRPNRNEELFSQFSLVYPQIFNNYYVFCKRYCDGHEEWGRFVAMGSSNEEELQFMMKKLCIRMRSEDVLDDLPEFRRCIVQMASQRNPEFEEKMSQMHGLLNKSSREDVAFELNKVVSELFRMTSELKLPNCLEYIKDNVVNTDDKSKIIIFVKHIHVMESVVGLFPPEHVISIDGGVNTAERTKRIARFLDPESSEYVAVLTLGSCSTGLNLTPVSKMLFVEMDWSPSILLQAECRINRIGGAKNLCYTYLLCKNTMDEYVFNKNFKKAKDAEFLVDGGVNYGDMEKDTVEKWEGNSNHKRQKLN